MKQLLYKTCPCWLLIILMIVASGCASSNNGNEREYVYRSNLGITTDLDVRLKVPRLLSRVNYPTAREEVATDENYFESEWVERNLFDDEKEMGISQARTMIIVSSRPLTSGATSQHRARIEIYNQVYLDEEGTWVRHLCSPQTEQFFRDLAREFRDELDSGIRMN